MQYQIESLLSSTCLSPRAWVIMAGASQVLEGEPPPQVAQSIGVAAKWIRAASCYSKVLVLGLLPVDVGDAKLKSPADGYRPSAGAAEETNILLGNLLRTDEWGGVQFLDCSEKFQVHSIEILLARPAYL